MVIILGVSIYLFRWIISTISKIKYLKRRCSPIRSLTEKTKKLKSFFISNSTLYIFYIFLIFIRYYLSNDVSNIVFYIWFENDNWISNRKNYSKLRYFVDFDFKNNWQIMNNFACEIMTRMTNLKLLEL